MGGGKALSQTAKDFREHVKKEVAKRILEVGRVIKDSSGTGDDIFGLDATFYFNKLENPGYFVVKSRGKDKGERKAKLRYKRVDTDNRLKFLQDWFVKCIGLPDDAIIFEVTGRKVQTEGKEHCVIKLYKVDRARHLPSAGIRHGKESHSEESEA